MKDWKKQLRIALGKAVEFAFHVSAGYVLIRTITWAYYGSAWLYSGVGYLLFYSRVFNKLR